MTADRTLELRRWADAVESMIDRAALKLVRRVRVFAETASTQDAAEAGSAAEPGLLVLAGRQTAGRGRLGRPWVHHQDMGIAATLTLAAPRERHAAISLAAGVGVVDACERLLAPAPSAAPTLGLRWPNDVVERSGGRKLAGILVEARAPVPAGDPLLLIGVGVNVLQRAEDFPPELRARATSLRSLGSPAQRIDAITALVDELDRALAAALDDDASRAALLEKWKLRDVLSGHPAAFIHDGRRYEGIVQGLRPDLSLRVRTGDGRSVDLPGASTSLVHNA